MCDCWSKLPCIYPMVSHIPEFYPFGFNYIGDKLINPIVVVYIICARV